MVVSFIFSTNKKPLLSKAAQLFSNYLTFISSLAGATDIIFGGSERIDSLINLNNWATFYSAVN
jgi:hypothetical protein